MYITIFGFGYAQSLNQIAVSTHNFLLNLIELKKIKYEKSINGIGLRTIFILMW